MKLEILEKSKRDHHQGFNSSCHRSEGHRNRIDPRHKSAAKKSQRRATSKSACNCNKNTEERDNKSQKTTKLSQAREKQTTGVYQNARKKARQPGPIREDGDINGISLGAPTQPKDRHHQSPRSKHAHHRGKRAEPKPRREKGDSESLDPQFLIFIQMWYHCAASPDVCAT